MGIIVHDIIYIFVAHQMQQISPSWQNSWLIFPIPKPIPSCFKVHTSMQKIRSAPYIKIFIIFCSFVVKPPNFQRSCVSLEDEILTIYIIPNFFIFKYFSFVLTAYGLLTEARTWGPEENEISFAMVCGWFWLSFDNSLYRNGISLYNYSTCIL